MLREAAKVSQELADSPLLRLSQTHSLGVNDCLLLKAEYSAEARGLLSLSNLLASREAELRDLIKQQEDERNKHTSPDSASPNDGFGESRV